MVLLCYITEEPIINTDRFVSFKTSHTHLLVCYLKPKITFSQKSSQAAPTTFTHPYITATFIKPELLQFRNAMHINKRKMTQCVKTQTDR